MSVAALPRSTARVPPHDLEAEEAVLGAMMLSREAIGEVLEILRAEDFYREAHEKICSAILDLFSRGEPVDAITVADELNRRGQLEHIGGHSTLITSVETVPAVANASFYAGIVAEKATKRRLLDDLDRARAALYDGVATDEAIDTLRDAIAANAYRLPKLALPFIDWPAFWSADRSAREWIIDEFLARARGHALYAKYKLGKSLLALALVSKLATSDSKTVVLYLDFEMTEDDVHERLEDMGYTSDTDLSRLHYAPLPSLPPLDTHPGGAALLGLVDAVQHLYPEHHVVVVIDTTSRAVAGEENSADTIRAFARHTGLGLKQRGVTWLRIDHAGKDAGKGQRGSSAKGDDVDIVWRLDRTDNGFALVREASRIGWVPERVAFRQLHDPLRFVRVTDDWPEGTKQVAALLDEIGVPTNAGQRAACKAMRDAGYARRNEIIRVAQRYRQRLAEGTDE